MSDPTASATAPRFPTVRKGALVGGAHYTLLVGMLAFDGGAARAAVLVLVGFISLFAWIGAWRRWRMARDTPTSRIRSAPQGYVELTGTAQPAGPQPLRDPVTHEPCLWFRVETYQQRGRGRKATWHLIKSAESSRSFLLRDHTGTCEVAPQGAEFSTGMPLVVNDGPTLQHKVRRLRAGDATYVAGHLRTVHDPAERHLVQAPPDGRPYLVSNQPDAHIGASYRFMAWVHLIFFFIGLAALGWIAGS